MTKADTIINNQKGGKMKGKPPEVSDKDWQTYLKVAKIVGGRSGKPTRTDPDYYAKIARMRWAKSKKD